MWPLDEKQRPVQLDLQCTKDVNDEQKPTKIESTYAKDHKPDEWETILEGNRYGNTLQVTVWALKFWNNSLA